MKATSADSGSPLSQFGERGVVPTQRLEDVERLLRPVPRRLGLLVGDTAAPGLGGGSGSPPDGIRDAGYVPRG